MPRLLESDMGEVACLPYLRQAQTLHINQVGKMLHKFNGSYNIRALESIALQLHFTVGAGI